MHSKGLLNQVLRGQCRTDLGASHVRASQGREQKPERLSMAAILDPGSIEQLFLVL